MSEPRYSVLLESDVGYGSDPEEVKEELSSLGLLSPEDIERLLTGKPVVLQSGLSHEQALRYQDALEAAGARSRLVASGEQASSSADQAPGADTQALPPLTWGGLSADDLSLAPAPEELETWMTCPKCGVHQVEAVECSACGVIVNKFTERAEAGEEAPWEGRDFGAPVDEEDMYQGPAHTGPSRRAARPATTSLKNLTGAEMLAMFTGVLASVGRMLLTAARIAGSTFLRLSRQAVAWLGDQIRSRLAERRGAQGSKKQQGAGQDGPGT